MPVVLYAQSGKDNIGAEIPVMERNRNGSYISSATIEMLATDGKITARPVVINGYQFTPRFSAGMGVGFTPYNNPLALIPVFVDLNYKILKTGITPFAFLRGGYGFSVRMDNSVQMDQHSGGFMLNPGTGIYFRLAGRFGLLLNIGFNIDRARFENELFNNRMFREDLTYKRLNFGLGLSF